MLFKGVGAKNIIYPKRKLLHKKNCIIVWQNINFITGGKLRPVVRLLCENVENFILLMWAAFSELPLKRRNLFKNREKTGKRAFFCGFA